MISIYRSYYPEDWEQTQAHKELQEKRYLYIKAKIEAEKLNPSYDLGNRLKFLNEIAISICNYYQRQELVGLLNLDDDDLNGEE